MDFRLTILLCLVSLFVVLASAYPTEDQFQDMRSKRDVMETMTNAWNEVVRTLSDAGDAVVHVFKPTEKSVITKMTEEVKSLTQ